MAHLKNSSLLSALCISVLCFISNGASAVSLDENSHEIQLSSRLLIAEDPSSSWQLEEAIAELAGNGVTWTDPGFPNFGFSTSSYWASVTIDNDFATNQRWLAKLDFASIDRVDFHYQDEDGFWVQKSAGDTLPFVDRDIKNHAIMLSFPVLAGQTQTLYFRVQTDGSVQMLLSLLSLDEYQLQSTNEFFWAGIYYGMIFIIALYSFIIWASTADRSYLYYVLFLFFGGLYSFAFQGFAYQYLWPDNAFWANRSIVVIVALVTAAGIMFVRSFLEVGSISRRYDKVLFSTVIFSLVLAVLGLLLPYALLMRFLIVFILAVLILISIAAWIALRPRLPTGRILPCGMVNSSGQHCD